MRVRPFPRAAQRKAEEEAEAARRGAAEAARFESNVRALEALEADDAWRRRAEAQAVQAYQLAQMADKKRVLESARADDCARAAGAGAMAAGVSEAAALSETHLAFAAAAEAMLASEEAKGRSTFALRRAIAKRERDPLIAATADF